MIDGPLSGTKNEHLSGVKGWVVMGIIVNTDVSEIE